MKYWLPTGLLCFAVLAGSFAATADVCGGGIQILERAVQRAQRADLREQINDLPMGVAVVAGSPQDLADLIREYRQAIRMEPGYEVASGLHSIVALGPLLDAPDDAVITEARAACGNIIMSVAYTSVRAQGVNLRRNIQWRPVARLQVHLQPGTYRIRVTWNANESLPSGPPLDIAPIKQEALIEVRTSDRESDGAL
jgi:hypothetical protein